VKLAFEAVLAGIELALLDLIAYLQILYAFEEEESEREDQSSKVLAGSPMEILEALEAFYIPPLGKHIKM
jgi:hypothetical protein